MVKRKTINITSILWVELGTVRNGKALLTLYGPKHKIVLHLERDMIGYLADHLWKFVKAEERSITQVALELRGEG